VNMPPPFIAELAVQFTRSHFGERVADIRQRLAEGRAGKAQ